MPLPTPSYLSHFQQHRADLQVRRAIAIDQDTLQPLKHLGPWDFIQCTWAAYTTYHTAMKTKSSWKTLVGGIAASTGLVLTTSDNPTVHLVGVILAAVGTFLTGAAARDNNVTSEQAGIK
jgi:2-polyprenyl-6-methoxyphenol hydroxylase-like FAD-dependent oxidoreductase